jgi:hypothetical protein
MTTATPSASRRAGRAATGASSTSGTWRGSPARGACTRPESEAFEARTSEKSAYTYENRHKAKLGPQQEGRFRANEKAWRFFQAQPPVYRQTAIFWVVSAKREETRDRRLATLIDDSAHQRRIANSADGNLGVRGDRLARLARLIYSV